MGFREMLCYVLHGLHKYEDKLTKYEGYIHHSIIKWKKETGFSWILLKKMINNLTIYSDRDIRKLLIKQYEKNRNLYELCISSGM